MNDRISLGIRCLAIGLLITAVPGAPDARAEEIIIAHPGVAADSVDVKTLEQIFLGKTTQLDADRISIAVLREGATHASFLTSYVNRKPKQFLSHWRMICFSGKGRLPDTFESESDLVAWVARTPGAIGYIGNSTPHQGVKVLNVQ